MYKRRSVKQNNRKVILDFVRGLGEFSIADVSEQTGISKTTVKKVLDFFMDRDLICETGKGGSSDEGGKRPSLFLFNKDHAFVISVHIGPGFLKGILTNLLGESVHSVHWEIKRSTAEEAALRVAGLIKEILGHKLLEQSQVLACVLGLPSVVDPESGVSVYSPHYEGWGRNVPFLDMVKEQIDEDISFYFDNINRFQAFAEKIIGCARDIDNYLVIDAIEEGVGAGVVLNGTIRHGGHNLSGEIGHMILNPSDGFKCICGGQGCFEAMVSRIRIETLVRSGKNKFPESILFKDDESLELDLLFSASDLNDKLARLVLKDIAFWFALGLNNIILVNDPSLIIIQGIYTRAGDWFLDQIKAELNKLSYPDLSKNLEIVYSELGRDRGVLGGAVYAIWQYFETTGIYEEVS